MRLDETERISPSHLREVSDLRTQFQCEYRLYLKQKLGETPSEASIMGTILHDRMSGVSQTAHRGGRTLPLLVIIMTLIVGLLWILW